MNFPTLPGIGAKIKLLKILEILQKDSDEEHPLSTYDICDKLEEMQIECDRKVLAKDIQILIDNGYDIVQNKQKGLTPTYFIGEREYRKNGERYTVNPITTVLTTTPII